jgi:hypothetical protein
VDGRKLEWSNLMQLREHCPQQALTTNIEQGQMLQRKDIDGTAQDSDFHRD